MAAINIPFNFNPRAYQKALYNCLPNGYNRGVAVWHRRAGKDKVFMAICAREAAKRVGAYFYILPYYKQARKVIWEGMDKTGFKMLDHIPPQFVENKNNQDMILKLKNGSIVTFLGSDNIDSIVGTNPVGVFFSEYSLHKENAWNYLRPILLENGGFALFNGTPRGRNHMWKMLQAAKNDEKWYSEILTIEDTNVVTPEEVEYEIEQGMPRAIAKQEFYCSFDAALTGAYYDEAMSRMQLENRIMNVPWEPSKLVNVAWDLGMEDMMVLILFQRVNKEIRIIDMYQNNNQGLEHYVKWLNERPYTYGYDLLPHDIKVRELGNGQSRYQTLLDLGRKHLITVPKYSVEDGINATRTLLNQVYIDKVKCDDLVEALRAYRAKWDEDNRVYGAPVHDWASHPADAMRMLACGLREDINENDLPAQAEGINYNPIEYYKNPEVAIAHAMLNNTQAAQRPRYKEQFEQAWNPADYLYGEGSYHRN